MSMNTFIVAFRPADEKWNQMKAVWDTCEKAGIPIPEEVNDFFGFEPPDDNGVMVDINDILEEWGDDDARAGYELDLTKLPKDITILRFYNSW